VLSQLFGGNDLFTTIYTVKMGRGKLQCGIFTAGGTTPHTASYTTHPPHKQHTATLTHTTLTHTTNPHTQSITHARIGVCVPHVGGAAGVCGVRGHQGGQDIRRQLGGKRKADFFIVFFFCFYFDYFFIEKRQLGSKRANLLKSLRK
jgi:hypothetical protein